MANTLSVLPRSHSSDLRSMAIALEDEVWAGLGFLSYTDAHQKHYEELLDDHADLQLCLVDDDTGVPVALANCVPANWDLTTPLPDEGWDWLVEEGGRGSRSAYGVLGALAISVPARHRGKGHAQRLIRELRDLADRRGGGTLIAPVRPSSKWMHPVASMHDYIGWKDAGGRCYDPWLRSHLGQDGRLLGVCGSSMVVRQHVAFWETWSGMQFEKSGSYAVEGGLVPVEIDLEMEIGTYIEPNVWVAYRN